RGDGHSDDRRLASAHGRNQTVRGLRECAYAVRTGSPGMDENTTSRRGLMRSRIMLRVMPLCAALLVTVGISGAAAQTDRRAIEQAKQAVDLLIGGEFVVTIDA